VDQSAWWFRKQAAVEAIKVQRMEGQDDQFITTLEPPAILDEGETNAPHRHHREFYTFLSSRR
jgi:hypothetical protein